MDDTQTNRSQPSAAAPAQNAAGTAAKPAGSGTGSAPSAFSALVDRWHDEMVKGSVVQHDHGIQALVTAALPALRATAGDPAAIDAWFAEHMRVPRIGEASVIFNHLFGATNDLKARAKRLSKQGG